jgi:hypothetical protein
LIFFFFCLERKEREIVNKRRNMTSGSVCFKKRRKKAGLEGIEPSSSVLGIEALEGIFFSKV